MKTLAFDLGRVVFDFDYNIALERIRDRIGVPQHVIIDALFYKDFAGDFEKGLVSSYDFYLKFINEFKANLEYQNFLDVWCNIFYPKKETVELLNKLKPVYPLYLISNINELHFNYLYNKFSDVFSLFNDLILSFEVKALKPEARIYQELKKVTNVPFEDIIYIDDRQDLIDKAKEFKLRCIKFHQLPQLIKDLEAQKIFVPSRQEIDVLIRLKEIMGKHNKPLLVGLGNRLRCDDRVGSCIAEYLENKISIDICDAKESLENYLNKIANFKNDLIIFIDGVRYKSENRFQLFSIDDIQKAHFYLTHDSSLNLAIQYLHKRKLVDILILGIRGYNFDIGEEMSEETEKAKNIIENFFIKNYSANHCYKI